MASVRIEYSLDVTGCCSLVGIDGQLSYVVGEWSEFLKENGYPCNGGNSLKAVFVSFSVWGSKWKGFAPMKILLPAVYTHFLGE